MCVCFLADIMKNQQIIENLYFFFPRENHARSRGCPDLGGSTVLHILVRSLIGRHILY